MLGAHLDDNPITTMLDAGMGVGSGCSSLLDTSMNVRALAVWAVDEEIPEETLRRVFDRDRVSFGTAPRVTGFPGHDSHLKGVTLPHGEIRRNLDVDVSLCPVIWQLDNWKWDRRDGKLGCFADGSTLVVVRLLSLIVI